MKRLPAVIGESPFGGLTRAVFCKCKEPQTRGGSGNVWSLFWVCVAFHGLSVDSEGRGRINVKSFGGRGLLLVAIYALSASVVSFSTMCVKRGPAAIRPANRINAILFLIH